MALKDNVQVSFDEIPEGDGSLLPDQKPGCFDEDKQSGFSISAGEWLDETDGLLKPVSEGSRAWVYPAFEPPTLKVELDVNLPGAYESRMGQQLGKLQKAVLLQFGPEDWFDEEAPCVAIVDRVCWQPYPLQYPEFAVDEVWYEGIGYEQDGEEDIPILEVLYDQNTKTVRVYKDRYLIVHWPASEPGEFNSLYSYMKPWFYQASTEYRPPLSFNEELGEPEEPLEISVWLPVPTDMPELPEFGVPSEPEPEDDQTPRSPVQLVCAGVPLVDRSDHENAFVYQVGQLMGEGPTVFGLTTTLGVQDDTLRIDQETLDKWASKLEEDQIELEEGLIDVYMKVGRPWGAWQISANHDCEALGPNPQDRVLPNSYILHRSNPSLGSGTTVFGPMNTVVNKVVAKLRIVKGGGDFYFYDYSTTEEGERFVLSTDSLELVNLNVYDEEKEQEPEPDPEPEEGEEPTPPQKSIPVKPEGISRLGFYCDLGFDTNYAWWAGTEPGKVTIASGSHVCGVGGVKTDIPNPNAGVIVLLDGYYLAWDGEYLQVWEPPEEPEEGEEPQEGEWKVVAEPLGEYQTVTKSGRMSFGYGTVCHLSPGGVSCYEVDLEHEYTDEESDRVNTESSAGYSIQTNKFTWELANPFEYCAELLNEPTLYFPEGDEHETFGVRNGSSSGPNRTRTSIGASFYGLYNDLEAIEYTRSKSTSVYSSSIEYTGQSKSRWYNDAGYTVSHVFCWYSCTYHGGDWYQHSMGSEYRKTEDHTEEGHIDFMGVSISHRGGSKYRYRSVIEPSERGGDVLPGGGNCFNANTTTTYDTGGDSYETCSYESSDDGGLDTIDVFPVPGVFATSEYSGQSGVTVTHDEGDQCKYISSGPGSYVCKLYVDMQEAYTFPSPVYWVSIYEVVYNTKGDVLILLEEYMEIITGGSYYYPSGVTKLYLYRWGRGLVDISYLVPGRLDDGSGAYTSIEGFCPII